MTLFDDKYYIIRHGDFATNGNKKIFYSMLSILLCIEEYISIQSTDCFRIMTGSTIVWTIIESFLYYNKTRVIKPMYFYSYDNSKVKLNRFFGIFLQGFQEGGVVTTIGLYFGDRLFQYNYLVVFHFFILYIVINMLFKNINNTDNTANLSKRQINTLPSLTIMTSISLYNSLSFYLHPQHRIRQIYMFATMIYISSIWTIIAYYKNCRSVEVFIKDKNEQYILQKTSYYHALLILGYDVFFEIGIAYLTFYNWFILEN
jgi:hypothetical protein